MIGEKGGLPADTVGALPTLGIIGIVATLLRDAGDAAGEPVVVESIDGTLAAGAVEGLPGDNAGVSIAALMLSL